MNQDKTRNVNEFLTEIKPEQRKWVIERLQAKSDAAAAKKVGISPATVCRWENKALLDWAVSELLRHPQQQALEILTVAVVQAARAKLEGLKFKDKDGKKRWHQGVATEVLNRVLGAPVQRSEVSGPEGGKIEIDVRTDLESKLREAVDAQPEEGVSEEPD